MGQQLLSRREAAKALGVSLSTLDELRAAGEIKYGQIGTRVKITRQEVDDYINRIMQ